jgi:flagellin
MGGISIQSNVSALRAQNALGQSQLGLQKSLERLSTGYRINSASDDAAGLAISDNLRADIRSLGQAVRNANDGMSVVSTAEGAMNEVSNILVRMRELSVQGASDSVGATERGYLDQEFGQLKSEIDRIVNTTEYNGQKLLDGTISATGLDFQIGSKNNADSRLTVTVGDVGASSLGLGTTASGVSTKTKAQATMSTIDTAITSLSTQRAKLGAYANRLQSTINNLNVSVENLTAANSRIRDVDVASETASFARSQVLMQAGVSMLAQANSAPMSALRLLG